MKASEVELIDGPLTPDPGVTPEHAPGCGAVLTFEGIVRPLEGGRQLRGLSYEAYEPMATTQLTRSAESLAGRFGVRFVRVRHSTGFVAVNERSFTLLIASPHRKEALAAMDAFIDELKRDVPIWKSAVYAEPAE